MPKSAHDSAHNGLDGASFPALFAIAAISQSFPHPAGVLLQTFSADMLNNFFGLQDAETPYDSSFSGFSDALTTLTTGTFIIPRVTAVPFGATGTTDDFETFGSTAVGSTDFSKDIAAIQATGAWSTGWRAALIASKAPVLQDMNAAMLVMSNLQCYQFQEGIPEYDSATTYYKGGVVKYLGHSGYTEFYVSLTDANVGQALGTRVSNANWLFLYALTTASGLIIPGSTDGSSVPTGNVGEYLQSLVPSFIALPISTTYGDLASLSLPAGDWDVSAIGDFVALPTVTDVRMGISTTSGNSSTGLIPGINEAIYATASPSIGEIALVVPSYRVSLATTTTIYLKFEGTYPSGAPGVNGARISARRWP